MKGSPAFLTAFVKLSILGSFVASTAAQGAVDEQSKYTAAFLAGLASLSADLLAPQIEKLLPLSAKNKDHNEPIDVAGEALMRALIVLAEARNDDTGKALAKFVKTKGSKAWAQVVASVAPEMNVGKVQELLSLASEGVLLDKQELKAIVAEIFKRCKVADERLLDELAAQLPAKLEETFQDILTEAQSGKPYRRFMLEQAIRQDSKSDQMLLVVWEILALLKGKQTETISSGRVDELIDAYRNSLTKDVGRVRLLGESEWRELKEVFVHLSINEEYERPSERNEWLGFMDAEMRQRKKPSAARDDDEEGRREKQQRLIKPADLLRDHTRAVITGQPGCGKSTLLRWLAVQCLQADSQRLPVFLELKTITQKSFEACEGNLVTLLFDRAIASRLPVDNDAEREALKTAFTKRLAANGVAILLDGLDEIRNENFFEAFCASLNQFISSSYGRNLLIVSSRPYAIDARRIDDAKEMEIAPLTQRQVTDFLHHYYDHDQSVEIKGLIEKLKQRNPGSVVRVPVLLGAIVRHYRKTGDLTEDRLKLYDELVRDLNYKLDAEKNKDRFSLDDPRGERRLDFLRQVAFDRLLMPDAADDTARVTFSSDWLRRQAKSFCQDLHVDPYRFADDVRATALVREIGPDVWAFTHLTLQEYLAAQVLAQHQERQQVFYRACFDETLVGLEVLPMMLGLLRNAEADYEHLAQLPESLDYKLLRLRARGLGYNAKISDSQLEQLTERLLNFICWHNAEETAYSGAVIAAFATARGNSLRYIVDRVVELLKFSDKAVQGYAASVLGLIGGEQAEDALLEALKENGGVRLRAAEALGQLGSPRAVTALLDALRRDAEKNVRRYMAYVLGQIGSQSIVNALLDVLREDTDGSVRGEAAEALGRIGGECIVDVLLEALKSSDPTVRKCAVEALGKIGGDRVVNALLKVLREDEDDFIQTRAAYMLGQIGGERALEILLAALKDADGYVRRHVAQALGQIGGEHVVNALLEELKDVSSDVRGSAAFALGQIGDERAVDALLAALRKDDGVRFLAAKALGQIGSPPAVDALLKALKDDNSYMRMSAAEALGQIGDERAVAALLEALKDVSSDVRGSAASALGRIRSARAVEALLALLTDAVSEVRLRVAEALGQIGDGRAVDALLATLTDEFFSVHWRAAEALEKIDQQKLKGGLRKGLSSGHDFARQKAAAVIGYYSDESDATAVQADLTRLAEEDVIAEVRAAAEEALRRFELRLRLTRRD